MKKIIAALVLVMCMVCPAMMVAQSVASGATEADAVRRLLGRNLQRTASPTKKLSAAPRMQGVPPTIGGSLLYRYQWAQTGKTEYGVYAFPAQTPISYTPLALNSNLFALGGGCYHDGRYCLVTYYETMGAIIASYLEYDTETWEKRVHTNNVGAGSIAVDMAYDPMTKRIYGCFINDTRDGYVFGYLDGAGNRTAISNLNGPLFAMACTSQGQIYAIDSDGRLQKVDKNTGGSTPIGLTKLRPYNSQSATIDPATDRLYWAACTQSEQGLYEVNLATAETSLIAEFSDGEEWGGLFVVPAEAEDDAPAAVTDLQVAYDPTSTANALVTFTLPSTTFSGAPLTGTLTYTVTLNDQDADMGEAQAGEPVTLTLFNTTVGEATIGVSCTNSAGRSPRVRTSLYLGHDAPAAVRNLKLEATPEGNVITWECPDHSQHGGYCNLEEVTYRVVRQPEKRVIANRLTECTFTDKVDPLVLSAYSYDVIPFAGSLQGESATTEKVLVGDAFELPYREDFYSEDDFELFSVVDANGDGSSWYLQNDGTAQSYYSMTQSMDDWLISPPIHLTTDYLYLFSTYLKVINGFPERMEVFIGNAPTPEAMTIPVLEAKDYHNSSYEEFTGRFGVPAEGNYYIGLHCITPAEGYRMNVDWISLDRNIKTTAPAAPELTVAAAPEGKLETNISIKAPTKAINGTNLPADKMQVKLYRGNSIVKMFTASPGEVLTFTDTNLPTGLQTYRAEPLNADGPGLEASSEVYVGIDTPALPTDVRLEMQDGKPHITWQAPTEGQHGGYIDPAALTYYVQRGMDEVLVASALTTLETTDRYFTMPTEQEEIYYYVYAASTTGMGDGQGSNILVVGPAYTLPFKESFTAGYLDHKLWGIIDAPETGYWGLVNVGTMPLCNAADGDDGLLEFQPYFAGDDSFLYSGKIDISKAKDPTLIFSYYYNHTSNDLLEIAISTNGADWMPVGYIDFSRETGMSEWREATISLREAIAAMPLTGNLQVGFRATSADGKWNMHLDNIRVYGDVEGVETPSTAFKGGLQKPAYDLLGKTYMRQPKASIMIKNNLKVYNK